MDGAAPSREKKVPLSSGYTTHMQHCTGHSSGMSKDDRLRSQATTKCHQVFNILRLHKESLYFQRKGVRGRVTL